MSDAANLDEKKPVEELTFREALSELESCLLYTSDAADEH